jgi:hypothetical protein
MSTITGDDQHHSALKSGPSAETSESRPVLSTAWERVSAEAVCEILHKARGNVIDVAAGPMTTGSAPCPPQKRTLGSGSYHTEQIGELAVAREAP